MMAADPELERVKRAFDAAFHRMCAATNEEQLEDELSNLLSQLYRLAELCKSRLGKKQFFDILKPLPEARAALWARTLDTHDLIETGSFGDQFSGYFTKMYGLLIWKERASLPLTPDKQERDKDYTAVLEGRPVLDTIRTAWDQLAGLARKAPPTPSADRCQQADR